jgi:AcrR family transcriptional regulator
MLLAVPRLWNETIEAHRRDVRDAIMDTTATLVAEQGLRSVTMSQIAAETGIGRATLYKYFPQVDAILLAWHERQIAEHLDRLAEIRDGAVDAVQGLEGVLEAYASIVHETSRPRHTGVGMFLHRGEHVVHARHRLLELLCGLLAEGAETGDVRDDVAPEELANYCLHALTAAEHLPSGAAVRRLVRVVLAGLAPRR